MDYAGVIDFLHSRDLTMSRYEREEWDAFTRKIGLSISFPFIHITGSNGKGSVAHYLDEIYRKGGYHVALFSKPYFHRPNEMIQMDGMAISDADFARIFSQHEQEIKVGNLSSFEIETYLAFSYFNEKKPDLAIIECGMGGTIDATNLLDTAPLLSIITTVSLEHTAFLGRTISEIASNKGGIIKENCPVLVGKLPEAADDVLQTMARRRQSSYFVVDDYHNENYSAPYYRFDYRPYEKLEILTPALYELKDAAIALEAVKVLRLSFPVSETDIRSGLLSPLLPCRMERHHNIIIDGAHNPEAIDALMESLVPFLDGRPLHAVFASYKDKNIAVELPRLGKETNDIILTTFPSERARDEKDYFLYKGDYPFNPDYQMVINDLVAKYPSDVILVTGSLAFAYLACDYVKEVLRL